MTLQYEPLKRKTTEHYGKLLKKKVIYPYSCITFPPYVETCICHLVNWTINTDPLTDEEAGAYQIRVDSPELCHS